MIRRLALLALCLALVIGLMGISAAAQVEPTPVDPAVVEETLAPGESIAIQKAVTMPDLARADVVISVDLTETMAPELPNLKQHIYGILDVLSEASCDINAGIVSHEDYPHYYVCGSYRGWYGDSGWGDQPFRVDHPVDGDLEAARNAVASMTVRDGEDWPDSYARVMWESGQPDSGIGYRAEAQKLLVMFLDSWPHDSDLLGDGVLNTGIDPGRDEVVYTGDDIDLQDDAIPAMQDADATLLVVYSGGASGKFVWDGIAGETGGSAVQINGDGTVPNGLSLAGLILSHIQPLSGNVWWEIEADPGLTVQLEPLVQGEVEGAGELTFLETIAVDSAAPQCETLQATVTFYAGGSPEEGDVIGIQNSTIHVRDVTPPEVQCEESANPHGEQLPPAGKAKANGPKVNQNPDGFYQLLAEDSCDPLPQIWVEGLGPFNSGDVVKITEAPGAEPSSKRIGSPNGEAGAVVAHIIVPADPVVTAVDASGNSATCDCCLVPPPPA